MVMVVNTLSCTGLNKQAVDPFNETKEQRDARMEWWRDARFGMFIHWGLYAVPGGIWNGQEVPSAGEWIMFSGQIPVKDYEPLVHQFNPVQFNAKEWVKIAKDAGMKYIVITSKHHDGFCLFDSNYTDYDIMSTPFKRDIMKELADECHKQGLKICWYHSIMDWHHPDYLPRRDWDKRPEIPADYDKYVKYMKNQLWELVNNYGDIGVLWFDGEWEGTWTEEYGKDVYAYLRDLQGDLIINNRVSKGRGGMAGMTAEGIFSGDFGTPEQEIPTTGMPGQDWETCMTMNDTWGFKKNDHNWKSKEDLIRKLIDIASKGGNFLLNVGPTAEGLIPQPSVERLQAMGDWLEVNGESIYDTTASVFPRLDWGRCTAKPGKLYLHVFDWPADGKLEVPGLQNKIKKAYLLADKKVKLEVASHSEGVTISLPAEAPDPIASVVVLKIEDEPDVMPIVTIKQQDDGTVQLGAVNAVIHGQTARYQPEEGNDNIGFWANAEDFVTWDFKLNQAGTYNVEITYACENGSGDSEYSIIVNDQKITGKIKETGSWRDFITEPVGKITLAQPGVCQLQVKPITKPNLAVMNLRSIVLNPE
jgi:alpha-L-fucosidase